MAFARYKGMAENALLGLGFARIHLFRPAYIYPVEPREEPNVMYRVSRALYPVLRRVMPRSVITSEHLGRAMLEAAVAGTPGHEEPVLENTDILAM